MPRQRFGAPPRQRKPIDDGTANRSEPPSQPHDCHSQEHLARLDGGCCADKTEYALQAAEDGQFPFLTRPQRFGKSLFLDTLAELYADSEALFRGLAAHGRWDGSRRRPVVRLGFAHGRFGDAGCLRRAVARQRAGVERRLRTRDPGPPVDIAERLAEPLEALHGETRLAGG